MSCGGNAETCAFERAHGHWIAGDFVAFMALFDDGIVWRVNIDGLKVPYASSALGKEDLRWRLQHMMDTFSIEGFEVEAVQHGPDACRSLVHINYVHKRTGELLDVKLRFKGSARDGLLVDMEEQADAAYVEAYSRFVQFLEDTARGS